MYKFLNNRFFTQEKTHLSRITLFIFIFLLVPLPLLQRLVHILDAIITPNYSFVSLVRTLGLHTIYPILVNFTSLFSVISVLLKFTMISQFHFLELLLMGNIESCLYVIIISGLGTILIVTLMKLSLKIYTFKMLPTLEVLFEKLHMFTFVFIDRFSKSSLLNLRL